MNVRIVVIAGVVVMLLLGTLAWRQFASRSAAPAASGDPSARAAEPGAVPEVAMDVPDADRIGVDWVVPRSWVKQIGGSMRLATYVVPGADVASDAECAVFYFGPGQGGGVDANLDRWSGEFDKIERQSTKRREIGGLKVATIEASGTFAGHTMKSGDAGGPKEQWGLLGAIVEGPNGDVFFKLTGPAATTASARTAFEEMLSSLHTH